MTAHASIPGQARPNSYAQQASLRRSKVSHTIFSNSSDKESFWGLNMWGQRSLAIVKYQHTGLQTVRYAEQIAATYAHGSDKDSLRGVLMWGQQFMLDLEKAGTPFGTMGAAKCNMQSRLFQVTLLGCIAAWMYDRLSSIFIISNSWPLQHQLRA